MSNVGTVQAIYDAFGRGDVPAILSRLSEKVDWEYGASPNSVPWLQARKGRDGAADFLASLRDLELTRFEPTAFFEGGGTVVVLLDVEGRVRSTGRPITEEDQVHIWHFDDQGMVARFRHRADTLQHQQACEPVEG